MMPLLLAPHASAQTQQLAVCMSAARTVQASLQEEMKQQEELVNLCLLGVLQPQQVAQLLVCCYPHLLDGVGFCLHMAEAARRRLGLQPGSLPPPQVAPGAPEGVRLSEDDVIRCV